MSVIATVAVPAADFPLGSLLTPDQETTVTVETTVPTSEGVMPYLWVPSADADSIVDALEESASVESASVIDEMDQTVLVKIEWNGSVNGVLEAIQGSDAIVTNATGTDEWWTFRLRFPSYEGLSTFYTDCTDRDISLELVQLHEAVGPESELRFGLTAAQRDLIIAAHETGYFDVPRRTTLVDLGDRFGVSDSAVSQRLRRGLTALIDSTLVVDAHAQETTSLDAESVPASEVDDNTDEPPNP
ncbi:bacterio-opsin activator domain-containing protein [Natrialbaceae archaeon A-arb3/5]